MAFRRASPSLHPRPSQPPRAGFGLTPAFRTGERRALRHDRADQPRRGERVDDTLVRYASRVRQPGQHSGEYTSPARRRSRDDHAHRGVHFLHGKRAREDVAEGRAGERARGAGAQLRGVAAHEAGRRVQITDQPLRHRAAHDHQRALQCVTDLLLGTSLIPGLRGERHLRKRASFARALSVANGICERLVHQAPTLSSR